MNVAEGMSGLILTVGPAHTLREATKMMAARKVGAAVVADPDGSGAGLLSMRDIVRCWSTARVPAQAGASARLVNN